MSSYEDPPSDVEKYSISPYLSGKDVATLLSVDKRRRNLYNSKYWEKRFLSEEGIHLPNYEDESSPVVRYSKAKRYLKAKEQFDKDSKNLEYYYKGAFEEDQDPPMDLKISLDESATSIIKYRTFNQVREMVILIEDADDMINGDPVFVDLWFNIAKYANLRIIEDLHSSGFLTDKLRTSIFFLEGRTDVGICFGFTKHKIMEMLLTGDLYVPEENLEKILDYASSLEGEVGIIGKENRLSISVSSRVKMSVLRMIEKDKYSGLYPKNEIELYTISEFFR